MDSSFPQDGTCGYCGEQIARAAELGYQNEGAYVLPHDPVTIQHSDAPKLMHKKCAEIWARECPDRPLRVLVPLAATSIRAGGIPMHAPAATPVRKIRAEQTQETSRVQSSLDMESERGCVLVASAWLDHLLEKMLCAWFPNAKAGKKLVDDFNSPLGTFSSRIGASFAIGLIVEAERRQLDTVRKLRNDFAHNFNHAHFGDQSVKSRIQTLPKHSFKSASSARQHFEGAVDVLATNLQHRTEIWTRERPRPGEIPWFYPLDDSGAVELADKVELPMPLVDPWIISLTSASKKGPDLDDTDPQGTGPQNEAE